VSQLKRNLLHYDIATLTSAKTFNQKIMVAKVLLLPFLGILQHFLGVALDRNPCSVQTKLIHIRCSICYHPTQINLREIQTVKLISAQTNCRLRWH
jgi:hypothetical protein